jgi:hypothetical protein
MNWAAIDFETANADHASACALARPSNCRLEYLTGRFLKELLDFLFMLLQILRPQPESINCSDYVPQQLAELRAKNSEALVKGIGQQAIVQVPD